jgi:cytochrome c biogenesis protein CcmG, thiol:disulfide interchange protein DsbE
MVRLFLTPEPTRLIERGVDPEQTIRFLHCMLEHEDYQLTLESDLARAKDRTMLVSELPDHQGVTQRPAGRWKHLPLMLFLSIVLLAALVPTMIKEKGQGIAVGLRAPSFTVERIEGGSFDLAAHLATDGRPVVLNLWASWCPPCRSEVPEISRFAVENPGVYVLGVTVRDPREETLRFMREVDVTYDIAVGDEQFLDKYPSFGLPNTFIIGTDGVITKHIAGSVTADVLRSHVP